MRINSLTLASLATIASVTFLLGLASDTVLGQNSVDCGTITPGVVLPSGFGAPYDVLSPSHGRMINVACNSQNSIVSVGSGNPQQYVYRQGYEWKNGAWSPISWTGTTTPSGSNWLQGSAAAALVPTTAQLTGNNYVLAYVCTWVPSSTASTGTPSGAWKCGCRDAACTQSFWQMQVFKYPARAPSATAPTGATTTATRVKDGCVIGGCSSELCTDPGSGPVVSTCMYSEVYACYQTATCEKQVSTGKCGWTQTSELNACVLSRSRSMTSY